MNEVESCSAISYQGTKEGLALRPVSYTHLLQQRNLEGGGCSPDARTYQVPVLQEQRPAVSWIQFPEK